MLVTLIAPSDFSVESKTTARVEPVISLRLREKPNATATEVVWAREIDTAAAPPMASIDEVSMAETSIPLPLPVRVVKELAFRTLDSV